MNDLSLSSAPLLVLRGHVDLAQAQARAPGEDLVAALVWGDIVYPNVFCLQYESNSELAAHCPDPYRFVGTRIETSVPLAPGGDGTFELEILRLPGADVSVGTNAGRVAYGSIVVGFDLAGESSPKEGPFPMRANRVVAATFHSLREPQRRLVFREGAFDRASYFYPLGCAMDVPLGFSIFSGGDILAPLPVCSTALVDQRAPLEVPILSADAARAMECAGDLVQPFPPLDFPPGELDILRPETYECLDRETLAVFPPGLPCGGFLAIRLRGCFNPGSSCTSPDWDQRANPPTWWPC